MGKIYKKSVSGWEKELEKSTVPKTNNVAQISYTHGILPLNQPQVDVKRDVPFRGLFVFFSFDLESKFNCGFPPIK